MDNNHQLDAPNNDQLKSIEQFQDRSALANLYRNAGNQFEGEIMSTEERDKATAQKLNAVTSSIWKSFFKIGLYIPYPLVSGILLAITLYLSVSWENAAVTFGLIVIAIGFWAITSYKAYASIFKIFYKHALRAGPFLIIMLGVMFLASEAIFGYVTDHYSNNSLLYNVALMSLITVIYSITASFIILLGWGNTKIKAIYKVAMAATVIVFSGFLAAWVYLF